MVEVPALLWQLPETASRGPIFSPVGSNDLQQFLFAAGSRQSARAPAGTIRWRRPWCAPLAEVRARSRARPQALRLVRREWRATRFGGDGVRCHGLSQFVHVAAAGAADARRHP
jgi:hypothetical protein